MEHYEMAELLSKKAGVSLEEARQALQDNDWDMLDAMVALERAHKSSGETVFVDGAAEEQGYSEPKKVKNTAQHYGFKDGFQQIGYYIKRLFQLSVETDFVIMRNDREILRMPVLVMLVLLVICFWFTLPVLVLGLFFGWRYHLDGKHDAGAVNRAMDKVADAVDNLKETLDDSGNQE